MEDGNIKNINEKSLALTQLYCENPAKLTSNGHETTGESSSPISDEPSDTLENLHEDKSKRINPLRIHLGKRPFVDNSLPYYAHNKKRKLSLNRSHEINNFPKYTAPRVPKLIPKRLSQFQNVHNSHSNIDDEKDKPVPRLVPKSQLLQFKKGKMEKGTHLKEYQSQGIGLQPMVKFKCRKCCSMSFKTLPMLKDHQLVCRAQSKEPTRSPEASSQLQDTNASGPSRVTRKVFLCSACGTYYENWNLFLHMREVHNRHICLFCLGMFSKAEKLSLHLMNKHSVKESKYDCKDELFKHHSGALYLMCCNCDEICSEQDDFVNHDCNNIKPKPVPVLVSKNSVKNNLKPIHGNANNCDIPLNGPGIVKDHTKPLIKNDIKEEKIYPAVDSCDKEIIEPSEIKPTNNTHLKSTNIEKEIVDNFVKGVEDKNFIPNGDETKNIMTPTENIFKEYPMTEFESNHVTAPEKEVGIKLKLSLNNASSPVIINSTVDPTVGQHKLHKPPSRLRRPPKRYEKNLALSNCSKPPTIRMTICDNASSPFIKSTVYEQKQEQSSLFNNNLEFNLNESDKLENSVKTTIYDNKIEDSNSLNRVPKLTVRVPKELLDKDSSSDYSSDSEASDNLTVDENNSYTENENKSLNNFPSVESDSVSTITLKEPISEIKQEPITMEEEPFSNTEKETLSDIDIEPKKEPEATLSTDEKNIDTGKKVTSPPETIANETKPDIEDKPQDIDVVSEKVSEPVVDEMPVTELILNKPLDKYPLKDLLRVFLSSTIYNCIYCNHIRKIAVNCEQLCLHMVAQHRFSATVDSITAEELMPTTIASKLAERAVELKTLYINLDSYDSDIKNEELVYDNVFECFQCYFKTSVHKDLCFHNRKMHQKTILLCVMCKSNFYSYSELLCHLCPGTYDSEYEIKFRCCFCNLDTIPSSFRLMVHLRKNHNTCDVCLEFCHNQIKLSNHVWKHKLHHFCYRCGIAYRNKPDITKHLFWKHGTESVLCKKCLQKKWAHIYHFCSPPAVFICEECSLQFTKAVSLKVHKRFHAQDFPHPCTEEGCTEKFVSKKLLLKHTDEHRRKLVSEDLNAEKPLKEEKSETDVKDAIPVIDLVNDIKSEAGPSDAKPEIGSEKLSKKEKKKKMKEAKDALLLDVNLPALNLSESDSSDESDSGSNVPTNLNHQENTELDSLEQKEILPNLAEVKEEDPSVPKVNEVLEKTDDISEHPEETVKNETQVLDIWDNFKKYQAKIEKPKEKTPPLVPIRKHVCESDHDYCLIPSDFNGEEDLFSSGKKKNKKSPKKKHGGLSSSSSSSSDSNSSCSCGSNCSCSSSVGSSSSSSSDSDTSDSSGKERKKQKRLKKLSHRRISNGSNVDVMGMSETPTLIPEKLELPIAESDLETEESDTDEDFYDEHPQKLANKLYAEKKNQLMLLASVAPSDGGSISREPSRPASPFKQETAKLIDIENTDTREKLPSSRKKSKKKKKSKSSKRQSEPIKLNIPKVVLNHTEVICKEIPQTPVVHNKITISLQSNTVQIQEANVVPHIHFPSNKHMKFSDSKRSSKRRRVPNKFYGYSSDEESAAAQNLSVFKPQQPPKLEWKKEDLPSPVSHKTKKEVPSSSLPNRFYNYTQPSKLKMPSPDPEPPLILMNSESMESSDSDSSGEGALQICQPKRYRTPPPSFPAPTYLNSGTSSLPYAFQRPPVRQAKEGESVYCYCRCPYDEVSEMIACDAEGCPIEWFHFECVGIMVPPKGKWYCPECRKNL